MRLIDEVALINEAESGGWDTDTKELRMILKYVPTIDAVPVVHGRWIGMEYDGYADGSPIYEIWECSECHEEHYGDCDTLTAYCPYCGAKMDGDSNSD